MLLHAQVAPIMHVTSKVDYNWILKYRIVEQQVRINRFPLTTLLQSYYKHFRILELLTIETHLLLNGLQFPYKETHPKQSPLGSFHKGKTTNYIFDLEPKRRQQRFA
ncbi:hypothetical protein CDAR_596841 [Caerostris darwini]|uniref:Uncharacterized protein n=1 Tax=Caerostris darwini TaxID=1538125 RepID=A0AAV4WDA5_9ARAC|nr:hypothetical protein CDAR_596841 [Caerostris darwini]